MPTRSGGRYYVRDGKRVLNERAGHTPEAEAEPVKKYTAPEKSARKTSATTKENTDADA